MKLSAQLICILLISAFFYSPLEATTTISENTPLNTCLPPGMITVSDITSVSARITWTNPSGIPGLTYQWEIGALGFTPGVNQIESGTVLDTSEVLAGLDANTVYQVYVRTLCEDPTESEWTGPFNFITSPGCGDLIYDSGGPLSGYQNNEESITTICTDTIGKVVSITFDAFSLAFGDTLWIHNGVSTSDVLLTELMDINLPPITVTSSNPNGCLTLHFKSNDVKTSEGFAGLISCIIPSSCFAVEEINVFNLQATAANFAWPPVFDAFAYEWEVRSLENVLISKGTTFTNSASVANLMEGTNYVFRVRTLCNSSGDSDWTTVNFFTPINCANKPELTCGPLTSSGIISATGQGIWDTHACGQGASAPGRERIFKFTAPNTRMYTFQTLGGSSAMNSYVAYAYKESIKGCGPFDWECIGTFLVSNTNSTTFGPLTAGKEYLILFDPQTTDFVQQSFRIKDCGPTNDEAPGAIALIVDKPCIGNIFSNADATFNVVDSLGLEPNPDVATSTIDELSGRWLTSADQTVWFKFAAPASGSVIVSTESIPQGGNFDTQLALYGVVDSSQYKSFKLIVSDDDNGGIGLGYNSEFSYSGLVPDSTYYIQVDGYSFISGTFCIQVKEGVTRHNDADCTPGYFVENVNGTFPDGNHWYDIYTRPDQLDLGDLLIAVKPGFQDLDTVFCKTLVTENIPYSINEIPYLPAYYNVSSSKAPTEPYTIRLFYHQAEFDSLVVKSNFDPLTTSIDDLVATFYSGPNEDCSLLNNTYVGSGSGTGTATLITDLHAVTMGNSGMFYVEVQVSGNGEIGLHLQQTALPVELKSFAGKIVEDLNLLEWTTATEKNVAWHMLERSADGISWEEIGRLAGQSNSTTPTYYRWEDQQPLLKSFYRLRSVDNDGQSTLSSIVVLTRKKDGLGIDRVYPSPTSDHLTIDFSTSEETDVNIQISDITGQIVLEQQLAGVKGSHSSNLSLLSLPAGMYIVSLRDGVSVVAPVRIMKK